MPESHVLRWNEDKPHRCPRCHTVVIWNGRPQWWRLYICCRCTARFARWPALARWLRPTGCDNDHPDGCPQPATHDYSTTRKRYWGHDCMTLSVIDGGQRLQLGIFGSRFQEGDLLILQNGDGSTRYRITEITGHPSDPGDLWFVTAEFAPRGTADG